MTRVKMLAALLFGAMALSACAAPPTTPATTNNPTSTTISVPSTPNPQDVPLPTLLPTVALAPTLAPVTVIVTATPLLTATPASANTRAAATAANPTTAAETATPFPEGVPKVYVTALRVEPATPKADAGGTFFVTFQNVSGENQGYNWAVEIWDTENDKRPFGLTTPQNSAMPVGASNLSSTGWTVKGLGECHAYRARVVARDADDTRTNFIQPDGNILWLDFSVCP